MLNICNKIIPELRFQILWDKCTKAHEGKYKENGGEKVPHKQLVL